MTVSIYTHNGAAHADEVIACAILKFIYPTAEIIRTRDAGVIKQAALDDTSFLLDIGLQYNPKKRLFDHHQPRGAGYRDEINERWPYATAGLVWMHYGAQAVKVLHPELSESGIQEIVRFIDMSILRYVDGVDCGQRFTSSGPSLSSVIASFNNPGNKGSNPDSAFELMLMLSSSLLTNYISRQVNKISARSIVRASPREFDGQVLKLDVCVPWADVVINEMPEVLMVIYPVGDGPERYWQMRAALDGNRLPRMTFPHAWRGLEGMGLVQEAQTETAKFCHRAGHLAAAQNEECIQLMAQQALAYRSARKESSMEAL